jgi:23S rRNA pseudouridine1911/1915/1917 synthase
VASSTAQNLQVLFEDNHLIAVNKRSGDIVQGDKTGDMPLSEVVKLYLKHKYNKPGNVFAGVVHRIDRPVTGVVIFAKTSKALTRLNALFQLKQISKTYWACVAPTPQKTEDTLVHFLKKDEAKNKSKPVKATTSGAKKSELVYKLLGHADRYSLLEVKPITGRHHQIRCQLSAAGFPIKGDLKYGSPRSNPDASIHLHARAITFIHPIAQTELSVVAPTPDDAIWNFFSRSLS